MPGLFHHGTALEVNGSVTFINKALAFVIDQDVVRRNSRERHAVSSSQRMAQIIGLDFLHGNRLSTNLLSHQYAVAGQRNSARCRTTNPFRSPLLNQLMAC